MVWQKAHLLVLGVYRLTSGFPVRETYGLSSQLRRAAVSAPANIAEGFKRSGKQDKSRFLNIAQGALEECRYFLILSADLGFGDNGLLPHTDEVGRILCGYRDQILASR